MKIIKILTLSIIFSLPVKLLSEEPIKIGIMTDLSGLGAYWGVQTKVGAELAINDLNKQGIKTEILFEDHNLKPKLATSSAQKLIFADKVDAIYSEFTVTVNSSSPIIKNAKKLMFGVCGGTSFLKLNPYSFKSYIDYTDGCRNIAKLWKTKGIKKIGALKSDSEYGDLCEKGYREIYPNAKVIHYDHAQDIRTQSLRLKKEKIEGVFNAGFEADIENMAKTFNSLNFTPLIASNFDAVSKSVLNSYESHKVYSFSFREVKKEFRDQVLKLAPNNSKATIQGAALAYLHIKQIVASIIECGKHNLKCQVDFIRNIKGDKDNLVGFKGFSEGRVAVFEVSVKNYG